MVNLHPSVDGGATVLLKVLARFLASCDEDWEIVYSERQYERNYVSVAVVLVKRTVEDNPGRPEELPIGTLGGSSSGGGHGEK